MNFSVSTEQSKKIAKWKKELDVLAIAKQKEKMSPEEFELKTGNGKYPYTGAIGGGLTYSFTMTSLGMIVKVEDGLSGEKLDVSDYDDW